MLFKNLFRHLSCVPKKGEQRRAPGENSLRHARVVLSTFRKLADRVILAHQSLALRERVRVRVGFVPRLRQSEMLHPRTVWTDPKMIVTGRPGDFFYPLSYLKSLC